MLLEAMAARKRLIVSQIPPFLEIAGDHPGVTYVSSGDVKALTRALCDSYREVASGMAGSPDYSKILNRFSWSVSVELLNNVLEGLL